MNKRIYLLLGTVAIVGIGVLVWKGVNPPKDSVEGTIGAANRSQSEQITGADVVLDPTQMNDIIQSDVFHRLARNPEFKKIVANENFKSIVAREEFSRLVRTQEFLALVSREDFNKFATSGELGKLALTPAEYDRRYTWNEPLDPVDLSKTSKAVVEHEKQHQAATEYLKSMKVPIEYEALTKSSEWQKLVNDNPDFAKLILNPSFSKAFTASPEMAKIITSSDFQKLVGTDMGARVLAAPELAAKALEY